MTDAANRLTTRLASLCEARPLDEKWLLAPSRRVGMQWLDTVARSGQPVLNFRVKTVRGFALELALPIMETEGVELLRGMRSEVLVDRVFGRLAAGAAAYLGALQPGPALTGTLARAIRDLRLAGLSSSVMDPSAFEVQAKGNEIKELLAEYERQLAETGRLDYAGAVRLAIDRLPADATVIPSSTAVVIPDYMLEELSGLSLQFWQAMPEANRIVVETDAPGMLREAERTNAALLSFIAAPAEAPEPARRDGTVEIFRAVGEVNEVREVLRRCVERGIPFDDVELLYTDSETYARLIYEVFCRLKPEEPTLVPVTFYEGIPTSYSRPARALLGWLSWLAEDYSQPVLVHMVSDGLLDASELGHDDDFSFARLGALLRSVPIGGGRDRYLPALDRELSALRRRLDAAAQEGEAEDEEATPEERASRMESLEWRIRGLGALRSLVEKMLPFASVVGGQRAFLDGAVSLLDTLSRPVNEFDQYCLKRLRDDIAEMAECLDDGDIPGFVPESWLVGLARSTFVEGKGPRPGCLYAAPVRDGGHSGRGHTFIIGLDDSRFPGTGRQDPLLLDSERARISEALPTGAGRLALQLDDFARLLSRIRGSVTLGYCCRSLSDDREMFPSPVVLSAYRILHKRDGDQIDLARWVGHPASFAPQSGERCIDTTEWWLSATCSGRADGLGEALASAYPNLGRGFKALAARGSDLFTEYDGNVPEAGADCNPACPDGPALSSSRLETLARCPLEYFLKYVLKVEPPEEYTIDPAAWLDPGQRGELLHSTFRRFMTLLTESGLLPDFERDLGLMQEVLGLEIDRWLERHQPPNAAVYQRERDELFLTAGIFLREEQAFCRDSRPAHFEVSIGLGVDEGCGTELDCALPAEIQLPGGLTIRMLGRIDRVDELPAEEGACFAVWDYKTGGIRSYDPTDPFSRGRRVQSAVYIALANARLQQLNPGARAVRFGLFFPGVRAHGERMEWQAHELEAGADLIATLCRMIAAGCFPFTDDARDVTYSDYLAAYGDIASAVENTKRKLANPENVDLEPFRELREFQP